MSDIEQKEPIINSPFEARGEDPEIDAKATNDALYNEPEQMGERGRRISDALMEMAGYAAEAFGDGARHIDLTDRYGD